MQDRVIEGTGTLEPQWQAWPGLHRLQCTTASQLVGQSARTVMVSPHPDDEILATGGLLATLAANGDAVGVVAVTDGGASHPGSSRWPASALTSHRCTESLQGLALLGLPDGSRHALRQPDGQVRGHMQSVVDALVGFLRADDLVISTWALDGHPDHEASAQATAIACARRGARHIEVPVWMWHWARPADARVPWTRMVRLPLSADALARKRQALAAHRTQLEPQDTGRPPVLAAATTARLLREFEFFILPA